MSASPQITALLAEWRSKEGRVVSCELSAAPMQAASTWMSRYERFWTDRLDVLERLLREEDGRTPLEGNEP